MEFILHPIGYVKSTLKTLSECPKQGHLGAPEAWIDIDPAFSEALHGLEPGAEIIIVAWMHCADRSTLRVHPQGNPEKPIKGVFATRSPARPNPISLHKASVLAVEGHSRLLVKPLEALDGTPILDIKIFQPEEGC